MGPGQRGVFLNRLKSLKSLIISNKLNFVFLGNLQKSIKNEVVGAQFGVQFINQCGPDRRGPFVNHRKTLKSLITSNKINSSFWVNLQKLIKNEVVGAQFGAHFINQSGPV